MAKQTRFFRTCVGVFQGGGCRGAALAGAYREAVLRGVTFSEVAGTSAGSIVAALIGAGATPQYLSDVLENLSFANLLTSPEVLCKRPLFAHLLSRLPGLSLALDLYYDRGIYSAKAIEAWVEDRLRELLPRASKLAVTFEDLIIPTSIIITDTLAQKVEVRKQGTHDKASVAQAVRASCSIPLFFQPLDNRYVDGGVLSNLPSFVFSEHSPRDQPLTTRILAFTLSPATQSSTGTASLDFFRHIADTVVEGSQDLQLAQQHDVHVISIPTYDVKATDFRRMDQPTVKKLVESGKSAAASFFDDELNRVRTPRAAATLCYDPEEVYSAVTEKIDRVDDVLIAEESTKFVYSLFPTLLRWRSSGVKVKALLLKAVSAKPDESYRRRLLRALGVQVCEVESVPVRAYLFNSNDSIQASAIVGVPQTGGTQMVEAVRYEGKIDSAVIQAVAEQINHAWITSENRDCPPDRPKLVESGWDLLEAGLRRVTQYSIRDVRLNLQEVELQSLVSLTRFARGYKYSQIHYLVDMYQTAKLDTFQAAAVLFPDGQQSIVTPPVVERSGDHYIVIEGTTRAVYFRDRGYESMRVVVADGVMDPLPAERIDFHKVRVVGRTLEPEYRYENFSYDTFRHIESCVHNAKDLT